MTLLVVHHTDEVGLGALGPSLEARQRPVDHVSATDGLPASADGLAGVLLLGGYPADGGDTGFPDAELDLVRAAVDAEVPVFGICAGSEAIALALGGEVKARSRPEAAWIPLHRTVPGQDDEVAAGWPDGSRALALHRNEVVRLPAEATQLLVGSDGPSLWRLGSAYGTPLHLEVDGEAVGQWLDGSDLPELAGVDAEALVEESRRRAAFSRAAGLSLLLRWVDGVAKPLED